jgi:hypothetical protein
MPVIYDSPIGVGEPHYCQMIKADKLKTWKVYPEVGWNPHTQMLDPNAPKKGEEGVVRDGNKVLVNMTAIRSHFTPEHVEINEGDQSRGASPRSRPRRTPRTGSASAGTTSTSRSSPASTPSSRSRRQARHVSLLLHRVLLGAAPGDDGLPAHQAQGGGAGARRAASTGDPRRRILHSSAGADARDGHSTTRLRETPRRTTPEPAIVRSRMSAFLTRRIIGPRVPAKSSGASLALPHADAHLHARPRAAAGVDLLPVLAHGARSAAVPQRAVPHRVRQPPHRRRQGDRRAQPLHRHAPARARPRRSSGPRRCG